MHRIILVAILSLPVVGCANVAYYAQATVGQMQLMAAKRPIPEVIHDPATNPGLRRQLEQVIAIREFASRELALPDNGSYRSYADLGRPFVVWNVFAAPEFSLDLKQWCMLFVGCVNYRGYYNKDDAELYAGKLRRAGADTYVGGVSDYSTLGHFDDPVLNTFLRFGDTEAAGIIFHELAHQLVYAEGDTAFNESFATTVEYEGTRRWLKQAGSQEQLRNYETQREHNSQFHQLVAACRDKLRAIYASPLTADGMRRAKVEVITEMKLAYADLKTGWGGDARYDQWFGQPINNATLGSVTLYTKWVPAFQALLEQEGGSLPHFYQRVTELSHLPKSERSAALDHLLQIHAASSEPSTEPLVRN
jgi:predicted aminopeptidase